MYAPHGARSTPVLAFPELHGTWADLARRSRRSGVLNYSLAGELAQQCLEGLSHVHQRHVVHRDLSPSNILVDISPCANTGHMQFAVKISDFSAPQLPDWLKVGVGLAHGRAATRAARGRRPDGPRVRIGRVCHRRSRGPPQPCKSRGPVLAQRPCTNAGPRCDEWRSLPDKLRQQKQHRRTWHRHREQRLQRRQHSHRQHRPQNFLIASFAKPRCVRRSSGWSCHAATFSTKSALRSTQIARAALLKAHVCTGTCERSRWSS